MKGETREGSRETPYSSSEDPNSSLIVGHDECIDKTSGSPGFPFGRFLPLFPLTTDFYVPVRGTTEGRDPRRDTGRSSSGLSEEAIVGPLETGETFLRREVDHTTDVCFLTFVFLLDESRRGSSH